MLDLSTLNEKQKEAVITDNDVIITIAGAGSGKTKTLTTKIAYLVDKGYNPKEILALTFTNKAANEMKDRISKMLKINRNDINAMTFHSFAVKVLRVEIEKLNLGFTRNFKILDEDDSKKIMMKILDKYEIDSKLCKDYLAARTAYSYGSNIPEEMFNVVKDFNAELLKANSLTFDDLQFYLSETFKINSILKKYQLKYKYILSDEFQDTDELQYSIIKKLIAINKKLFVVLDTAQKIYSFRIIGDDAVKKLMNDFPNYHLIKLEQNYRSTPEILNLANHVIKNNKNEIDKTLFTKNPSGLTPTLFEMEDYKCESERIVSLIKQLKNKGFDYKDMAILYRINSLSRTFEEEFIKNKIPYKIHNGTSFYQREEIKDIISYLRLIADDNDNYAYKRIINKPRRRIGEKTLEKIEYDAAKNQGFFYSMFLESENFEITKPLFEKVMIARGKYFNYSFSSITELVDYICKNLNYNDHVETMNSSSFNNRYKNIEELKNIITEFEKDNPENFEPTRMDYLNFFLQSVALYSNANTDAEGNEVDAVNLMTIHSSKGLEFPIVFLPALEQDIFPIHKAYTEEAIEEERRLYYVGVTRAMKYLFLSNSKKRLLNGLITYNYKSQFVTESKDKIITKRYY